MNTKCIYCQKPVNDDAVTIHVNFSGDYYADKWEHIQVHKKCNEDEKDWWVNALGK